MSEYPSQQNHHETPPSATLFDDDFILYGITKTPEENASAEPAEPSRGAAIEIGARAVAAVENIMATYNQLNKTEGARKTSAYVGNDFSRRYSKPEATLEGMGVKGSWMIHRNRADFDYLNNEAGMRQAGFSEAEINTEKEQLKNALVQKYGPNRAYAGERKKFITKVKRSARNADKSR